MTAPLKTGQLEIGQLDDGGRALATLRRLLWRARLRRFRADLKRPKKLLLMAFGVLVLGFFIWSQSRSGKHRSFSEENARVMLSCFLTFLPLISIVASIRNGAIAFTPSEAQFLLPAPISNRALVRRYLTSTSGKSIGGALMFGIFLGPAGTSIPRSMAVFSLYFVVMVLLQTRLDMAYIGSLPGVRRRASRRALWWLLGAVALALGAGVLTTGKFIDPGVLVYVTAPVRPFVSLMLVDEWTALLWLLPITALCALLLRSVLGFKGDVREAAQATSDKIAVAVKRVRGGQIWRDKPREETSGKLLPRLPWWGGAGPHAWRQLSALRRSRRSFLALFVMCLAVGISTGISTGVGASGAAAVAVILMLVGPMYVQCDFRSDYEVLPYLRSLPSSPGMLALGQMLASTIVLTGLQLLLCGWGLAYVPGKWMGVALIGLLGVPALNLCQLSIWNASHLLSPVKLVSTEGPPGLAQLARFYIGFIATFVMDGVVGAGCFLVGFLASLLMKTLGAGQVPQVMVGTLFGVAALWFAAAWCAWLVGRLFVRVDPSRDLMTHD